LDFEGGMLGQLTPTAGGHALNPQLLLLAGAELQLGRRDLQVRELLVLDGKLCFTALIAVRQLSGDLGLPRALADHLRSLHRQHLRVG
jgi:hypothetical protein